MGLQGRNPEGQGVTCQCPRGIISNALDWPAAAEIYFLIMMEAEIPKSKCGRVDF